MLVYALFSYMHFPCTSLQTTAIDRNRKRNMVHELKCDDFFIGNCKENVYFGFCRSSSRMSPCSLTDEGKGRGQKWWLSALRTPTCQLPVNLWGACCCWLFVLVNLYCNTTQTQTWQSNIHWNIWRQGSAHLDWHAISFSPQTGRYKLLTSCPHVWVVWTYMCKQHSIFSSWVERFIVGCWCIPFITNNQFLRDMFSL